MIHINEKNLGTFTNQTKDAWLLFDGENIVDAYAMREQVVALMMGWA